MDFTYLKMSFSFFFKLVLRLLKLVLSFLKSNLNFLNLIFNFLKLGLKRCRFVTCVTLSTLSNYLFKIVLSSGVNCRRCNIISVGGASIREENRVFFGILRSILFLQVASSHIWEVCYLIFSCVFELHWGKHDYKTNVSAILSCLAHWFRKSEQSNSLKLENLFFKSIIATEIKSQCIKIGNKLVYAARLSLFGTWFSTPQFFISLVLYFIFL